MTRRNSLPMTGEDVEKHNARVREFKYGGARGGKTAAQEANIAAFTTKNPNATVARFRHGECIVEKSAGSGSIGGVDAELRSLGVPMDALPKKKRPKYGNQKTAADGAIHDSKREAKRYRELGLLLKAGEIDFLARQVRFRLPGGVEYVADFVYGKVDALVDAEIPGMVEHPVLEPVTVEDAKGVRTAVYRLKAKQMLSEHGIKVVEV